VIVVLGKTLYCARKQRGRKRISLLEQFSIDVSCEKSGLRRSRAPSLVQQLLVSQGVSVLNSLTGETLFLEEKGAKKFFIFLERVCIRAAENSS
jgi:hypothetical protein